jgi:hypothetical protein
MPSSSQQPSEWGWAGLHREFIVARNPATLLRCVASQRWISQRRDSVWALNRCLAQEPARG